MARPDVYTAEQIITAIRDTKGMVSLAARKLGCHPDTIRSYAKRYSTVAAALKEERETMTDTAELSLYKAIQGGEAWAVCFYLKTQGKGRGYTERHEISNQNWDMATFSDDELGRIADGESPEAVVRSRKS